MNSDEIKKLITVDDMAIISIGVATVYQMLNIKVPRILGMAGTAFTVLAMMKTITRISDERNQLLANQQPVIEPQINNNPLQPRNIVG